MSLMTGQAPPHIAQPRCKQRAAPPAGLSSGQPSSSASTARTGFEVTSEHVDRFRKTDQQQPPVKTYRLLPTPSHKRIRDSLPVSRIACRQAVDALVRNARDYTYQQWYMWYIQDEFGADLFEQELKHKLMPSSIVIQNVVLGRECCGDQVHAPRRLSTQHLSLQDLEPEISPVWTDPARTDLAVGTEDEHIAGILSQTPGRLWRYMTGHLKTFQSPINRGHFDDIQCVKVPAFWSTLLNPSQLQHGLASISEKEISQDGWARCVDASTMPPELVKPFDYALLEPVDKIPDENAFCVAFTNYAVRALQIVICEPNMFKHQLMWDGNSAVGA